MNKTFSTLPPLTRSPSPDRGGFFGGVKTPPYVKITVGNAVLGVPFKTRKQFCEGGRIISAPTVWVSISPHRSKTPHPSLPCGKATFPRGEGFSAGPRPRPTVKQCEQFANRAANPLPYGVRVRYKTARTFETRRNRLKAVPPSIRLSKKRAKKGPRCGPFR